jgi:hypothetical protein
MKHWAVASLIVALAIIAACSKPAQQSADPQAPPAQPTDPQPAAPQSGGLPPSHGMVMTTTIVITNSGATNLIGYRILIGANGDASYVSGDGPGNATLPAALFAKLKGDVDAAKPLSGLPRAVSCMKSASFGTSTYLALGGDRTDDLTCPGNEAENALKDDIDAVVAFLKLRNTPRSEGKDLPPQNF